MVDSSTNPDVTEVHNTHLRVASWPGYELTHNGFIHQFLDGIAAQNCEIISCKSTEDIANAKVDVLILHWLDALFWTGHGRRKIAVDIFTFLKALRKAKRRGTKIIWVVHNLQPHGLRKERRPLWSGLVWSVSRLVDGVLTLSPKTVDTVVQALPVLKRAKMGHIWHPAYAMPEPDETVRDEARAARGLPQTACVIGYCGMIRPYKGIEELIHGFRQTTNPDLRLLVAGEPKDFAEGVLEGLVAGDTRIQLHLGTQPIEVFNAHLASCDVFAAPLRSYLHSGSLIHGLSAGLQVLTPRTPFSSSLQDLLGQDWVHLYDGALGPDHLASLTSRRPGVTPDLSALQPNAVGKQLRQFVDAVLISDKDDTQGKP